MKKILPIGLAACFICLKVYAAQENKDVQLPDPDMKDGKWLV